SLGCVLFRCLTGRTPFEGDDILAVLLKVALEEPPHLRDLCLDAPPALDDLVAAMLAKQPAERPHNGRAAAAPLSAIQRGLGAVPCATASASTSSARSRSCSSAGRGRAATTSTRSPPPPTRPAAGRCASRPTGTRGASSSSPTGRSSSRSRGPRARGWRGSPPP